MGPDSSDYVARELAAAKTEAKPPEEWRCRAAASASSGCLGDRCRTSGGHFEQVGYFDGLAALVH